MNRWTLASALGITGPELVAFVGGGGKTSLMMALAAALPGRVVITTTTRIFAAQMRLAPAVAYAADLSSLGALLDAHGRCLVVGGVEGDKALGVPPDLPARLLARPDVDAVLVEADGSRMRPVKAPAQHEPVIPEGTTLLVPMAGLDALEGPIGEVAHRPERVAGGQWRRAADAGPLLPDDYLTVEELARLLIHQAGGLKGVPDGARAVVWLNKVEGETRLGRARAVARLALGETRVARVVVGAARAAEPVGEVWRRVTAVVLAAGESRRMGTNKLLLPWGASQTVLGQTLANARASVVHNLLLVTGHEQARIEAVATEATIPGGITTIHNGDYAKGMLASVQAAVRALPPTTDAILVILGDQPMIDTATLDRLLFAYAASPAGLVAPTYDGRRGNPVLIDRRYFAELLALPPEAAPRVLLARHAGDLLTVPVGSEAILLDLDRPEEYARLRP